MRKLFAALLVAATASANEMSYRSLQSGPLGTTTPLFDQGLHGEGQVIGVLDTGLDWESCYFAEDDQSRPPINTGTPGGGYEWRNLDLSRRKVIAYDFLYSCDQFPGAAGCDDPSRPGAFDNQDHGTHAAGAATGDRGARIIHDFADSIAPGAKLVVQDAGYIGGDSCSQRPGIGCPVNLTPILEQAWKQGVRIHSNSWGDRQGTPNGAPPPTANYPQSARDVDAFVWSHPDMLVVFNTGNLSTDTVPPASSLSAPGSAKNTLQVGGTRGYSFYADDVLAGYSLRGPSRDGRIKPDVVGPADVTASDGRVLLEQTGSADLTCGATQQGGTSWAAPTVAGAAALVRQYYVEGFYPDGRRAAANSLIPSAALLKATIIASARPVLWHGFMARRTAAPPPPSYDQGFGFPSLDDALHFTGDRARLRVVDSPSAEGLAVGERRTLTVNVRTGTRLRVVLVWTDFPGTVRGAADPTPQLVNDLDLSVVGPGGQIQRGNEPLHPGERDVLNNVEAITLEAPAAGIYTIAVDASRLGSGPRQGYALVVTGDFESSPARVRSVRR